MRAAIAASRLRPESEEMLFNVFGAEYLSVCNRLLTKEWMRTPQVKQNLRVMFNVTLDDNNAPKSDKISEGSEK